MVFALLDVAEDSQDAALSNLADGEQIQIFTSTSSSSSLTSSSSHWFPSVGPPYPAPPFVFSAYRKIWVIVKLKDVFKQKNGTQTPDDEADVTLVDESVSQVIFIKESESSCAISSSPVLSTSQSAPVVTSVDESSCRQGQRLQFFGCRLHPGLAVGSHNSLGHR
jgi:hypothetical protein